MRRWPRTRNRRLFSCRRRQAGLARWVLYARDEVSFSGRTNDEADAIRSVIDRAHFIRLLADAHEREIGEARVTDVVRGIKLEREDGAPCRSPTAELLFEAQAQAIVVIYAVRDS